MGGGRFMNPCLLSFPAAVSTVGPVWGRILGYLRPDWAPTSADKQQTLFVWV